MERVVVVVVVLFCFFFLPAFCFFSPKVLFFIIYCFDKSL